MANVEYVIYQPEHKPKSQVPVTQEWQNARMVRTHSINATVREILNFSKSLDVVKVNIIGSPSTGKTTLAQTIAHQCHMLADIPYTVKLFKREDLLDLEKTIKNLQPMNHVLIFDDISWLSAEAGKRQLDKIQKTFTEIRHLPGGQDVKIIMIFNFHYNMSVPKHLRQSDFFYWTSIGSSELENTQKIVGVKNTQKLIEFRGIYQSAITSNFWEFKLGTKGRKFRYDFRLPFAPTLFWNNTSLRHVVFPSREWIDKICADCSHSQPVVKENMNLVDFDRQTKKFGKGTLRQALRIKFFQLGVYTYSKSVKQCMAFIDGYMANRIFNAEQLAEFYDLKDLRIRPVYELQEEEPMQEQTSIVLAESKKTPFPEYDGFDYNSLVAELEKMTKLPQEEFNREKYEYLNERAKQLGVLA